ncbi:MAG: GGDEF domain-containing protein [Burkholderiales bacterium]
MRRYNESRENSGELLRMIIPMMSAHKAGLHPVSYAAWYEYAAGINPPLKEAIDRMLTAKQTLDDEAVYQLHERFIAGTSDTGTEKLRHELQRLISEISGQAATTGEQARAYTLSLDRFSQVLRPDAKPAQLRDAVNSMIEDTGEMRSKAGALQERLEQNAREIESLRSELQRVRSEAMTDPLTGIANRRGLEQAVADIRASGSGGLAGCSLLALDIDHFKKCNDSYGHLFGDKVIRTVAQILQANVKGRDLPARIGGEEFVVLLPATPLDGACVLAERIRSTIAAGRIRRNNGELIGNITLSIGVAHYRNDETLKDFLERADQALYDAKNGGRNRVSIFSAVTATA